MTDMTITNSVNTYATTTNPATTEKAKEETAASTAKEQGVVFEKSKETPKASTNQIYSKESVVAKLKADQEARIASMQSLVQKLLTKNVGELLGITDLFNIDGLNDNQLGSMNLAETFRKAASNASPEDIAQAKADIAEDGYWGVEQTSNRMVSMAIALSGGDTSKADLLMESIQKGYEKATKAWGEELPQISKDTLAATMQKMEDWKNGVTTAEDYNKYFA